MFDSTTHSEIEGIFTILWSNSWFIIQSTKDFWLKKYMSKPVFFIPLDQAYISYKLVLHFHISWDVDFSPFMYHGIEIFG